MKGETGKTSNEEKEMKEREVWRGSTLLRWNFEGHS